MNWLYMGNNGEEKMIKRDLVIKNRLGLIIFSVLLMIFTSVMAYAGEGRFAFSDLTATDKSTGLVWMMDANIAKESMTWKDAFKFIEELNKQKYGGYSDWRLPTTVEFQTLIDYAKSQKYDIFREAKMEHRNIYQLFNKIGFRNVQDALYWSSSPHTHNPTLRWGVHMLGGRMGEPSKTTTYYVWPVRGDGRRLVFSDLTVKDKETGLIWTRNANLAGKKMTWKNAFKFIEKLNKQKYAGHSDWKLPTESELKTLVYIKDDSELLPYNNLGQYEELKRVGFKNVQADYYWSSTTYEGPVSAYTDFIWVIGMIFGSSHGSHKTGTCYVWPVRAGK